MRKLLLSFLVLGTVAATPVCAAPASQPALAEAVTPDQPTVQLAQFYGRDNREFARRQQFLRRQEFRRRQEIRRERFNRRQAYRRGYYGRPY